MTKKLIIVADLGLLRAYREKQDLMDHKPHLELIDEMKPEAAHEKLSEKLTDDAGRFPRGSGPLHVSGDMSAAARPNLEIEEDRRLIDKLADRINALVGDPEVKTCLLAASAPIHKKLLDALAPGVRDKISEVLASNLTKIEPAELPGHFQKAGS